MGHTVKRCPQPVPEEDNAGEDDVEVAPAPIATGTWGNTDEAGGW
jgi:hypothetical protein